MTTMIDKSPLNLRLALHRAAAFGWPAGCLAIVLAAGCTTVVEAPASAHLAPRPAAVYAVPSSVVSVYVDPPIIQPAPLLIGWAPPPMLVDLPPPQAFSEAVWIGGYWTWQDRWVWASGRWAAPPQPYLVWANPYYENRNGGVVFVTGHWHDSNLAFVPPPQNLNLSVAIATPGAWRGPAPIGPSGVFVPSPPGSRLGIIVPAPIGTAPSVVTSAPPVVNVGMRVTRNNVNNVINVTNVENVTIVAPPGATANGKAFESQVPAVAHRAAALPAVVHTPAPTPPQAVRPAVEDKRAETATKPEANAAAATAAHAKAQAVAKAEREHEAQEKLAHEKAEHEKAEKERSAKERRTE